MAVLKVALVALIAAGGALSGLAGNTAVAAPSVPSGPAHAPAPVPAPTPSPPASPAPATPADALPPLEVGAEGPWVAILQERLAELRYDPGPIDGKFGRKTEMAVWALQHTYGLPADGKVTSELGRHIATAGPPAPLVPDGEPNRTEISLERQVLYLYRDGQLALITHISSGTGQRYCDEGRCGVAITPTGSYRYERRISGWRDAPLGLLYNPVYFHQGYAVHGSHSVPNGPASHGCVRIPMHIAEYFPSLVANGDAVHVL